jgi:hypothetical protein
MGYIDRRPAMAASVGATIYRPPGCVGSDADAAWTGQRTDTIMPARLVKGRAGDFWSWPHPY